VYWLWLLGAKRNVRFLSWYIVGVSVSLVDKRRDRRMSCFSRLLYHVKFPQRCEYWRVCSLYQDMENSNCQFDGGFGNYKPWCGKHRQFIAEKAKKK
jgi:hypothetical protein